MDEENLVWIVPCGFLLFCIVVGVLLEVVPDDPDKFRRADLSQVKKIESKTSTLEDRVNKLETELKELKELVKKTR